MVNFYCDVLRLGERMSYVYYGRKPGKGEYTCTSCGQMVVLDDNTDTLPPRPKCNGTEYTP